MNKNSKLIPKNYKIWETGDVKDSDRIQQLKQELILKNQEECTFEPQKYTNNNK